MRSLLFIFFLLNTLGLWAQHAAETREPANTHLVKPLADSIWKKMSVRQQVDYSLKIGEQYMQLCGRWDGGYTLDTRHYIFGSTRQLYFLGEYTYSKRQLQVFNTYPDSLAWFLREDLFEKKGDLFYWHNIIRYMQPARLVAKALLDYYEYIKQEESVPLTLLMGWMRRDSFSEYMRSAIRKEMDDSHDLKIAHSKANKEVILKMIRAYSNKLPDREDGKSYQYSRFIYDSLQRADSMLRKTGLLDNEIFNRLNARELLAYCEKSPEKYGQICGFTQDIANKIFLLPDKYVSGKAGDFSERQIKLLKEKRDSIAWYILNGYRDRMIDGRSPNYSLVLLLHIWQIIPDLLKMDRVKLFNRYFYMSVFCQFMLINSYPPFMTFWKKNAVDNSYVIRTPKNEEMILQLAADYYQWKMEGKDQ